MVFSSLTFLFLFLPAVLLIYFLTPGIRVKNIFLLLVSLLFYAWGEPNFVVLMVLSTLVNYLAGLRIAGNSYRRVWLACSVILNLSFLVYFKYTVFIVQTVNRMLHFGNLPLIEIAEITLPIGISFYTFQSISYLIDTYRKPETVQRNPLDLGLYIAFFPQLIAGPIVRYFDIREQIKERSHSIDDFAKGVERFDLPPFSWTGDSKMKRGSLWAKGASITMIAFAEWRWIGGFAAAKPAKRWQTILGSQSIP